MKRLFLGVVASCLLAAGSTGALAASKVTIKVAYENNPGEPVDQVMHYWGDLLKEKSKGEITFDYFPSSQLGSKKDVMEQGKMGMNIMTIADVGFLTDYDPDLGILFGPYLTDDPQQLFKIYESDWFKEKDKKLQAKGIHIVMTNYLYGVRQLLTKKPVKTIDDLKGMKVRVPNNVLQIKAFQAMGATPTPMPLGEVYPALTTGVIDGVENPIPVLYGQKLHEQAKYMSMIGYLTNTSLWLGGEAFFGKLPPEQLKLIHETAYQAGLQSQKVATEQDNDLIAKMKSQGVEFIYPDVKPFKEATKAVYKQFPEWSPNLYDTIQAALKK